jgi:CBS domain containing-hemolysin-like protein
VIGLSLALVMRLGLLAGISWVMSLTEPLFALWQFAISWRDLILIGGGLFLLIKATTEIHERIEAGAHERPHATAQPAFWPIVAQIVVLDAVFSLDSIITAIGMVDHLAVMVVAVIIAVGTMLVAARPLTQFIIARPTLIILCLSFLLMIGLVLVVDGLGLHVPKSYVYTAIGFSVLIEILNQLAARRRREPVKGASARQQVADAVLRMLGGLPAAPAAAGAEGNAPTPARQVFAPAETEMVREVLRLADKRVTDVMTPRDTVEWLDVDDADALAEVRDSAHREFPVAEGSLDKLLGVVRKEDILALCVDGQPVSLRSVVRDVPSIPARASVLDALERFKRTSAELALVIDDQDRFQGVVTRTDLLEAIAGEFPDEGE